MEPQPPNQPQQAPQSPPSNHPPKKQGMSTGAKVGMGCGIAALICVITCAVGGWWFVSHARQIASGIAASSVKQVINNSNIPADQKQRIVQRVDDLKDRFAEGEITGNELGRVAQKIVQGPILPVGMVMLVEQQYIQPSSLSETEKQDARLTLDRLARGLYEEKIDTNKIDHVIAPISTRNAQGERQLKQNPTEQELREFLSRAEAEADDANIPNERFQVDLAAAFDQAVQEALNETSQDSGGNQQ